MFGSSVATRSGTESGVLSRLTTSHSDPRRVTTLCTHRPIAAVERIAVTCDLLNLRKEVWRGDERRKASLMISGTGETLLVASVIVNGAADQVDDPRGAVKL